MRTSRLDRLEGNCAVFICKLCTCDVYKTISFIVSITSESNNNDFCTKIIEKVNIIAWHFEELNLTNWLIQLWS